MTSDGAAGLNLRFAGDEVLAVRIDIGLLNLLHQAIGRLKEKTGTGSARFLCRVLGLAGTGSLNRRRRKVWLG